MTDIESKWRRYYRKGYTLMRPYLEGESMRGISVSLSDKPEVGGMIAMNKDDESDQWYVAEAWFKENYYTEHDVQGGEDGQAA